MSAPEPKQGDSTAAKPGDGTKFLLRQAPYLVALLLALAGVAYTNIARQALTGYWELLALAMAVMCVVTQWESASDRSSRFRLIGTQALHLAAVLLAMNIMVLNRVQSMLPAPALSLVLLTLLALGTFLAGVSILSLQICFLGLHGARRARDRVAHAVVSLPCPRSPPCSRNWRRGLAEPGVPVARQTRWPG